MTPAPRTAPSLLGALVVLVLDFGLLALGVGGLDPFMRHPRALALFASWLIATPVLALLRPVRSRDLVAARPDRLVLLTLLLIPMFTPALSALGERRHLWLLAGGAALRWGGVALSVAGLALRIAAMRQLGSRFSPLPSVQRDHALETGGLYGFVRHPGYLGAFAFELGVVLAFGSAATLPLVLLMGLAIGRRVATEEGLLEERFGGDFRGYRARVGGFVPRLRSGRGSTGNP
jgi:protein-S-isoprenylcysteine O-methyltransferase Ste14